MRKILSVALVFEHLPDLLSQLRCVLVPVHGDGMQHGRIEHEKGMPAHRNGNGFVTFFRDCCGFRLNIVLAFFDSACAISRR